jgi:hypothetical protein
MGDEISKLNATHMMGHKKIGLNTSHIPMIARPMGLRRVAAGGSASAGPMFDRKP